MGQVSPFLRRVACADGAIGYGHYCPGCDTVHIIWTAGRKVQWAFNQDVNRPTFSPSVRLYELKYTDEDGDHPERTTCHYHLIDGALRFCADCEHVLSGSTVPLPSLPLAYADGAYGWPGE